MRKLVYFIASTIDGFIADSSGDDPSGTVFGLQGDHVGALVAEYPEMIPFHVRTMIGMGEVEPRHFDTVLEGRASYEIGRRAGVANAYPHLRHLVFSSTLGTADDPAIEVITDDAVTRIRELKAEPGLDIWLCGGGKLAAAVRAEIDEIHLKVYPVVLGSGVPLFDEAPHGTTTPIDHYELDSCRPFDSGVTLMIYRRRR